MLVPFTGGQSSQKNPVVVSTIKPGTNTSFATLKQINTGLLNVGYAEAGPTNGPAVIHPPVQFFPLPPDPKEIRI